MAVSCLRISLSVPTLGPLTELVKPTWVHKAGTWRIDGGQLVLPVLINAALWLKQELPQRVRIEFTAKAMSDDGDIKAEVFGDGRTHQSGYILLFGGWKNTVRAIARRDEHGEDRKNDNRCVRNGRRRCVERGWSTNGRSREQITSLSGS